MAEIKCLYVCGCGVLKAKRHLFVEKSSNLSLVERGFLRVNS